jgi:hypothetical protein
MLRAVEKFEKALLVAESLVEPGERIALMVGQSQVEVAVKSDPRVQWHEPIAIPSGNSRVLLLGTTLVKVE